MATRVIIDDVSYHEKEMKILITGYNGCGKSSLINCLFGKLADEDVTYDPFKHPYVNKYECCHEGIEVTIYDTRGFGDNELPNNEKTMHQIIKEVPRVDLVLICLPLYEKIIRGTKVYHNMSTLLKVICSHLAGLAERFIFVFTQGDKYEMHTAQKSKFSIADQMKTQQEKQEKILKRFLRINNIDFKIAHEIPSCITCCKTSDTEKSLSKHYVKVFHQQQSSQSSNAVEVQIPTSSNWVRDLWNLCKRRCQKKKIQAKEEKDQSCCEYLLSFFYAPRRR